MSAYESSRVYKEIAKKRQSSIDMCLVKLYLNLSLDLKVLVLHSIIHLQTLSKLHVPGSKHFYSCHFTDFTSSV